MSDLDRKPTVTDFKTAASRYDEHEAILSDQLSCYQLAEPEIEDFALCVLVKTKEPMIEWHMVKRSTEQLAEYLEKVDLVAHEIQGGHFYKRPGTWCSWCYYLPVCLGRTEEVEETLIKV